MSYDGFIEQNKARLVALYVLSQRFCERFGLQTPYPPSELSDEELYNLKEDLDKCMPRESMMIDLWDWDIHFERELSDDWYFETVFGDLDSAQDCADELADLFLEKVDEYEMDYDQHADPDAFESLVHDEAVKFVTAWRQAIFDRYAQQGAPEGRYAGKPASRP
jgi:hypothetical protein